MRFVNSILLNEDTMQLRTELYLVLHRIDTLVLKHTLKPDLRRSRISQIIKGTHHVTSIFVGAQTEVQTSSRFACDTFPGRGSSCTDGTIADSIPAITVGRHFISAGRAVPLAETSRSPKSVIPDGETVGTTGGDGSNWDKSFRLRFLGSWPRPSFPTSDVSSRHPD